MTTGSHPAPYRIPVTLNNKDGLILIDQIRTLDKVRLVKKVGEVNAKVLTATLTLLQEAFTD
jgi:mRNA interferase MazF